MSTPFIPESDEEFELLLETAPDLVVVKKTSSQRFCQDCVDFFAQWCGPCHQIAPFFATIAGQYEQAQFFKVDVDRLQSTTAKYQVTAMPTFIFFKNGQPIDKIQGANQQKLLETVQKHLGQSTSKPAPSTPSPQPTVKFHHFMKDCSLIETGDKAGIVSRLKELSQKYCLREGFSIQETLLDKIAETLNQVTKYHATTFSAEENQVMSTMVEKWEGDDKFPALDLLRLFVLHPDASKYCAKSGLVDSVLGILTNNQPTETVLIMGCRFLANCFKCYDTRQAILSKSAKVMEVLHQTYNHEKLMVRRASMSAVYNMSLHVEKSDDATKKSVIGIGLFVARDEKDDRIRYLGVQALGTVLCRHPEMLNFFGEPQRKLIADFTSNNGTLQQAFEELQAIVIKKVLSAPPPSQPSSSQPSSFGNQPSSFGNQPSSFGNQSNFFGNSDSIPQMNPMQQQMAQQMAQDPEVLKIMQDPSALQELMSAMSNPNEMVRLMQDPRFARIFQMMMNK